MAWHRARTKKAGLLTLTRNPTGSTASPSLSLGLQT